MNAATLPGETDYSLEDIDRIARAVGMTFRRFVELDLPKPDYCVEGKGYLREETWLTWWSRFVVRDFFMRRAKDPERAKPEGDASLEVATEWEQNYQARMESNDAAE